MQTAAQVECVCVSVCVRARAPMCPRTPARYVWQTDRSSASQQPSLYSTVRAAQAAYVRGTAGWLARSSFGRAFTREATLYSGVAELMFEISTTQRNFPK